MNDVTKISQAMAEVDKAIGSQFQGPQMPRPQQPNANLPMLLKQIKEVLEKSDRRLDRIEAFLGIANL